MTEFRRNSLCLVQRDGIQECELAAPHNGRGDAEGKSAPQHVFITYDSACRIRQMPDLKKARR